MDLSNWTSISPLPVPELDDQGRPEGAAEVVAQAVVSREEADRMIGRVGFTLNDEAADQEATEARKKEARQLRFGMENDQGPQPCEPGPVPAAGADLVSAVRKAPPPRMQEVASGSGSRPEYYDISSEAEEPTAAEASPCDSLKPQLVNTTPAEHSGHFRRCPQRPLNRLGSTEQIPGGYRVVHLPEERTGRPLLYVQQLAGPPKFSLPWYDAPPYDGKQVSPGMETGTLHGPVSVVVHVPRQPETATRKAKPGFVVAGFRNPFVAEGMEHDEDAGPALVYINVWCTDNNAGRESGAVPYTHLTLPTNHTT